MAILSGTERDLYVRKYSDAIDVALRQAGGLLLPTVTLEPGVMGERTIFKRFGDVTGSTEHTTRFEQIDFQQINAENRYVTPKMIDVGVHVDKFDLLRMSGDVNPEIVEAVANEIRRKEDLIILAAMGGTAAREVDGSSSAATFDSNNTIAVNDNANATSTVSGDSMLHEGKLISALNLLHAAHVSEEEDVFVLLTSKQATALRVRMNALGISRLDFVGREPQNVRGAIASLQGFLGLNFIRFEPLAAADQLSGGDEYVYVTTRKATKHGIWSPLEVTMDKDLSQRGHPDRIYAQKTIGSVRMDESRIVRALCNLT